MPLLRRFLPPLTDFAEKSLFVKPVVRIAGRNSHARKTIAAKFFKVAQVKTDASGRDPICYILLSILIYENANTRSGRTCLSSGCNNVVYIFIYMCVCSCHVEAQHSVEKSS